MNNYKEPTDAEMKFAEDSHEFWEQELKKPKLIFKYKSLATSDDLVRFCNILQENKIYMPTIKKLNDPLESKNSELLGITEEARIEFFEKYRVLSLTENPLLPTLWAYYADNYSGVCIGFWTDGNFSSMEKVSYCDKQKMLCWDLTSGDLYKKSGSWSHEQEWRIIGGQEYFHFDKKDIACVIFGCKVKTSCKKLIEEFIPDNVAIFTVNADSSKFCLFAEIENQKAFNSDEIEKILVANHKK